MSQLPSPRWSRQDYQRSSRRHCAHARAAAKPRSTHRASPGPTAQPTLGHGTANAGADATPLEPTAEPTLEPTALPTLEPTGLPTLEPTGLPTLEPTGLPTLEPTGLPTLEPTLEPSPIPTMDPSPLPTLEPSPLPTGPNNELQRALTSLYRSTGGNYEPSGNWETSFRWLSAAWPCGLYISDPDAWTGIYCEDTVRFEPLGNVIRINLNKNKLSGTLPTGGYFCDTVEFMFVRTPSSTFVAAGLLPI